MGKIFISYAREDVEVASQLYYDLKTSGLDPWIDREDLLPGQHWKEAIREVIHTASHFIVLLSNSSTAKRGFLDSELYQALEVIDELPPRAIFIIPARLNDCQPSHPRMRELNWVDLFPSYSAGVEKIIKAIKNSRADAPRSKSPLAQEQRRATEEAPATRPLLQRQALPQGTVFAHRYRIEELLGHGGMGTVYRVIDISTGYTAALKVLSAAAAKEAGFSERFAREIHLLARLSHPCIPRILNAGVAEFPYFVAEYVPGRTLRQVIDETGSLSAEQTAGMGASVADALAAAHSQGIIHRDIKPQNIMIGHDGCVFLIDFGIARAAGPDMRSLTETGMLLGTPHYMAPEQIEHHHVDERSDIYSLGVVLFEAVTGRVPFSGTTPFAVARQHADREPPRPKSIKSDIPPSLEHIILRCLDKKPGKRPWSAAELAALLRKPQAAHVRKRRLGNGDFLEEAPAEIFGYALKVISRRKKEGWDVGMALHLAQALYKLVEILPCSGGDSKSWEYRFVDWPAEEVLRKLVDYDFEIKAEAARSPWFKFVKLLRRSS